MMITVCSDTRRKVLDHPTIDYVQDVWTKVDGSSEVSYLAMKKDGCRIPLTKGQHQDILSSHKWEFFPYPVGHDHDVQGW